MTKNHNKRNYVTEEQADQLMLESNGLHRQWYQIEIPIRQDVAKQLLEYEGKYKNGSKEVKLTGDALLSVFTQLCLLVDYTSNESLDNKKHRVVYKGYTEDKIVAKLKIGKGKWLAIKELLYNCGLIELIKRSYTWHDNEGNVYNGTRNIIILNRMPEYALETEQCFLNFHYRNLKLDIKNNNISKQYISKNPKTLSVDISNEDANMEKSTMDLSCISNGLDSENEKSTMDLSCISNGSMERSTMEKSTVERSTMDRLSSKYNISSNYINQSVSNNTDRQTDKINTNINNNNNNISSKSVSQSVKNDIELDFELETEKEKEILNSIIAKCELEILERKTASVLKNAITQMFYSKHINVVGAKIPQSVVRENLQLLNGAIINNVLYKIQRKTINTEKINNTTNFLISCIYNGIFEFESDVLLDPELNRMKNQTMEQEDEINSVDVDVEADQETSSVKHTEIQTEQQTRVEKQVNVITESCNSNSCSAINSLEARYRDTEFELPILELKNQITKVSWEQWFNSITNIEKSKNVLKISSANSFAAGILKNKYKDVLEEAFRETGVNSIEFEILQQ